jgi:hypothetical protein
MPVETTKIRKQQSGNGLSSEVVRRQAVAGTGVSSSTPAASKSFVTPAASTTCSSELLYLICTCRGERGRSPRPSKRDHIESDVVESGREVSAARGLDSKDVLDLTSTDG